jgi:hypothetical protein
VNLFDIEAPAARPTVKRGDGYVVAIETMRWMQPWWHMLYVLNCQTERAMLYKQWERAEYLIEWIDLVCHEQAAYQCHWLARKRAA